MSCYADFSEPLSVCDAKRGVVEHLTSNSIGYVLS